MYLENIILKKHEEEGYKNFDYCRGDSLFRLQLPVYFSFVSCNSIGQHAMNFGVLIFVILVLKSITCLIHELYRKKTNQCVLVRDIN